MEPNQQTEVPDLQVEIENALNNKDLPHFYFNGFTNSVGTGDVLIILKRNNKPIAVLNMSYTIAKSLSVKLGETVKALEELTGNTIMTTDDILSKIKEGEHDQ